MKSIHQAFFRGLLTLLPITVTVYILYSAIVILENVLGSVLRILLPVYIPGLGLILTLVLIYLFGLLLNNFLIGRILLGLEHRLTQVPFLKAIYSPLRDLMNLFSQKDRSNMGVVLVRIGNPGVQMLGIVTRENFSDLQIEKHLDKQIAIYMPLSYGMGGYTVLVHRDQITEINLPIEKAMSLAITGWVRTEVKSGEASSNDSLKGP